ncbi:hypothetical protein E2542_SST06468 [Spatholobus suberectus]|nr:hypothetical protein E2542_SST06468 [Spatholobus suberectus]
MQPIAAQNGVGEPHLRVNASPTVKHASETRCGRRNTRTCSHVLQQMASLQSGTGFRAKWRSGRRRRIGSRLASTESEAAVKVCVVFRRLSLRSPLRDSTTSELCRILSRNERPVLGRGLSI